MKQHLLTHLSTLFRLRLREAKNSQFSTFHFPFSIFNFPLSILHFQLSTLHFAEGDLSV